MPRIRRRARPIETQHARLRVRRRVLPLAALFPFVRWMATMALIAAVAFGATKFFSNPFSVGALEFTPHIVGKDKSAAGVKSMATGDMTGNGKLEIVTVGRDGVKIYSSDNQEDWNVKTIDSVIGERVQLVDLNNNGRLDILVSLREAMPSVKWYRNDSNLSFVGAHIGTGELGYATAGDINKSGSADIVTSAKEGEEVALRRWMNNGSGVFSSALMEADSGVKAIALGNINCGPYTDIVTVGSQGLSYWTTTNGSNWSKVDIESSQNEGTHLAVGDVTRDGRLDIVVADRAKQEVALYRNLDCQQFDRIVIDSEVDAVSVLLEDFNRNGNIDVLVAASDDNSIFWYDHDGSRNFTRWTVANNIRNVFGLAVADINGSNELDFVTGDYVRGTVYWYERLRARPRATAPGNIRQTTDGSGRIIFETTVADADRDPTSIRVQYSLNGDHWYKPWLVNVTPSEGSVDLKNSNGYQIGTGNPIDTDKNESVTLTLTWDTKSHENTGGPIKGDINTVQLRVIPRDDHSVGPAAVSPRFRVDNQAPQDLSNFRISAINPEEAILSWTPPRDSSSFKYSLYYGTNHAAVLEKRSSVWNEESNSEMGNPATSSTTITGLQANQTYTFKLFVTDVFGNEVSVPSATGATFADPDEPVEPPVPTVPPGGPTGTTEPPPPTEPTPETTEPVTTRPPFEFPTPTPTQEPSPTPDFEDPEDPIFVDNQPPVANAGDDILVNPSALIILDGTASYDPDGSSLSYTWTQIDGTPVDIKYPRTATPSFTAGDEGEVYIFALTVRDPEGDINTDIVSVAVRRLSEVGSTPVDVDRERPGIVDVDQEEEVSFLVSGILNPLNILFFILSLVTTVISLLERTAHSWSRRKTAAPVTLARGKDAPTGKVLHYKTGEPIANVQVLVYGSDKKLRTTERTNNKGEFNSLFPAGEYSLGVKSDEFTFAPTVSGIMKPESGILYTGGALSVKDGSKPLNIIIPMKPTGKEVASGRTNLLHAWQAIQHMGRTFSWPLFLLGALLNTTLVFLAPAAIYLIIEVFYVILVIVKISLEVQMRPAYGIVRDAITHVPLDLAVVRLFEQGTNRLVMTRVTNTQGKFFALPPAGKYTITITKPAYAVFSKQNVEIAGQQDSTLQITADLMPVAPQKGGLQAARAAVL